MIEAGYKEICVVLPRGEGAGLPQKLAHDLGITTTTIGGGRGFSERNDVIREVDLIKIIVSVDQAEALFAYLYDICDFSGQESRFMYQAPLTTAFGSATPTELAPGPIDP